MPPPPQDVDAAIEFNGQAPVPGFVGPYSAEDWGEFRRRFFGFDGDDALRGPVLGIANDLYCAPDAGVNMDVNLSEGAAMLHWTLAYVDTVKTVTVPNWAGPGNRYDILILRRNGNPAVNIVEIDILSQVGAWPALTQNPLPNGVWEIPLWRWIVTPGETNMSNVTLEDRRYFVNLSPGTYPEMVNNSGNDLERGTIVQVDGGADQAFTTANDPGGIVHGVLRDPADATAAAKVCVLGITPTRVTGVVARGDMLQQSAVAGVAQSASVAATLGGVFGTALEASAGGTATILVLVGVPRTEAADGIVYQTGAGGYTNNTVNWLDVDAVNITVTIPINTGRARVFCSFHGSADNAANSHALFDLREVVSGVRAGDATYGLAGVRQNSDEHFAITGLFTGLTRGLCTFRLQFRNFTAGAVASVDMNAALANLRYPLTLIAEEF